MWYNQLDENLKVLLARVDVTAVGEIAVEGLPWFILSMYNNTYSLLLLISNLYYSQLEGHMRNNPFLAYCCRKRQEAKTKQMKGKKRMRTKS